MDEEDQFKEKEEEDFRQDKIVIYNEVLDIMRSIAHLYRKKVIEAKAKRMALGQILSEFEEQQMFLIGDASGNMDGKTSLTMEKSLLVEAWARYRPNSKENSPRINAQLKKQAKKDVELIFGENFIKRLISGIR